MNVTGVTPFTILPSSSRPRIPYQERAPSTSSTNFDLTNITTPEAAKLAVDLYNDGKISLHELGAIQLAHPDVREDGSPSQADPSKRWNILQYAQDSIDSCLSRNDAQGAKIYQHIFDVLQSTNREAGRRINLSA